MKSSRLIPLLVAAVSASGCQQNPFANLDTDSVFRADPAPTREIPPILSISVPAVPELVFQENVSKTYPIQAIGAPGTRTTMTPTGLPDGAIYDAVKGELTWKPSYDQGTPGNVGGFKRYEVIFTAQDAENPALIVRRKVALTVEDVARPNQLQAPASAQLSEGTRFATEISINTLDYPNQNYDLRVDTDLVGVTITRLGPSKFEVSYTPSYRDVKYTRTVTKAITYYAFGPNGQVLSQAASWVISEVAVKPTVSGASRLRQGPNIGFSVFVEDPNGLSVPSLAFVTAPGFGSATVTELSRQNPTPTTNPSATYQVSWVDIPFAEQGKTHTLPLKACISFTNCTELSVAVEVVPSTALPPLVDRSRWGWGETQYVKVGQKPTRIRVPVQNTGSGTTAPPSVRIEPATSEVSYDALSQTLVLDPQKAGVQNFKLIATSTLGVSQTESFRFEALPADWAETVVLAPRSSEAEVGALLRDFPGAALFDPAMQALDERAVAFRKRLVIGTVALKDAEISASIEGWLKAVPSVLIASPLVAQVQGAIEEELKLLGVKRDGRLGELSPPPELSTLLIELSGGSTWEAPAKEVGLQGKLTSESASPAIVDAAVGSRACKSVLSYRNPAQRASWSMAVECKREGGGSLLVSGLEFGDLVVQAEDVDLVKKWLAQWGSL